MTDDEARQLVDDGVSEMRAAFEHFDQDRNGRLDANELQDALADLGQAVGRAEVRRLIASVDPRGSGEVDFDGFVALIEPQPVGLDPEADIRLAFDILDADRDGYLTVEELTEAARHTSALPPSEANDIVAAADTDGDGRVSFDEFRALLTA